MTNKLLRNGTTVITAALKATPAIPAYTSYETETVRAMGPVSVGAAPAGWGYKIVTQPDGSQTTHLVYLGTIPAGAIGVAVATPQVKIDYITTTRQVATFHPAVAAVPGSPAIRVDTPAQGWTSSAHSLNTVFGAGEATFSVAQSISGAAIGLSHTPNAASGTGHIPHGLIFTGGKVYHLVTGALLATFVEADVFKVRSADGTVTYFKGATVLMSEASTLVALPVYLDAVLFAAGDYVNNPTLAALNGGYGRTSMRAVRSFGSQVASWQGRTRMAALKTTGYQFSGGRTRMGAMRTFGSQLAGGQGRTAIKGMRTTGYQMVVDIIRAQGGDTILPGLLSSGVGPVGQLMNGYTKMGSGIRTFGSEVVNGQGRSKLGSLRTRGYNEPAGEAYIVEMVGSCVPVVGNVVMFVVMLDGVGVAAAYTTTTVLEAAIMAIAGGTTNWATAQIMEAFVYAIASSGAFLGVPAQESDTWVYDALGGGSTSYTGYDFNSFATISGKHYGANETGIHELDGDTDNGGLIRASIGLGLRDFGLTAKKTISEAFVGMSAKGNLFLKVIAEDEEYIYSTEDFADSMQQQRIKMGKGLKANYFDLTLYNEEGSDFELDTVQFMVADLSRKI